MTRVLGVDAAARQWLAILLVDGRFAGSDLQPSITALLRRFPEVEVVGVDIPIGLPVGRTRPADQEAKRFVGVERAASVFPTFPREVLATEPYKIALEKARELFGSGVSTQGYALRRRIFEVEAIPKVSPRVVEVHPEVSFRALHGAILRYSKHSWSGILERRAVLASASIFLPDELPGGGRAAPDDVVDAAVAAWTAMRVAKDRFATLPAEPSDDPADGGVIHY